MTTVRRIRAVIKYGNKQNIVLLLLIARAIHAKMAASTTMFPTPLPSLAVLLGQINALSSAQDQVHGRVPGAATVRNAARDLLLTTLEGLRVYVQGLGDLVSAEQAAVLIEAAGMKVAAAPTHARAILDVHLGVQSSAVILSAAASLLNPSKRRKTYGWQYTTDGGKTWLNATSTPVAHTTIAGLPPLTVCGFRVNVTDTRATTEWSQVLPTHLADQFPAVELRAVA